MIESDKTNDECSFFFGGSHEVPEEVMFNHRNAESRESFEARCRVSAESIFGADFMKGSPETATFFNSNSEKQTTLSGAPKPQRIPYRLENIEEAQIETA